MTNSKFKIKVLTIWAKSLEADHINRKNVRVHESTPHNISSRKLKIVHSSVHLLGTGIRLLRTWSHHFHLPQDHTAQ
jgi:hypothetical protein